ncbi:hypothetical protein MHYP_G00206020 [Metynnis hypsauchen]
METSPVDIRTTAHARRHRTPGRARDVTPVTRARGKRVRDRAKASPHSQPCCAERLTQLKRELRSTLNGAPFKVERNIRVRRQFQPHALHTRIHTGEALVLLTVCSRCAPSARIRAPRWHLANYTRSRTHMHTHERARPARSSPR